MEFWDEPSPEKFPMLHPKGDPPKQKDGLELLAKREAKFTDILKTFTSGQVSIQCCVTWREEKKIFEWDT